MPATPDALPRMRWGRTRVAGRAAAYLEAGTGRPVVVIWGRRDGVITEASLDALQQTLGDARTITVAGGHNWLLADPDRFGEVITNVVEVAERARWLHGARRRWWRLRKRIRTAVRPIRAE